ncbi:hypothetical protein VVD49_01725 [Uliginosibacterium sp. H3]|uniref:Uncharacterized protein n=1 Tax=Uliginosibacterium silvisoli TaxID=3114758 RepID=A0ABU6K004_9RHOO|nr:hypothetical protein [Uliginosibacterium sp. H3]
MQQMSKQPAPQEFVYLLHAAVKPPANSSAEVPDLSDTEEGKESVEDEEDEEDDGGLKEINFDD